MKAIIDNVKFDTETAEPICGKQLFYINKDLTARYLRAIDTLYQKKNGQYFIYHESLKKVPWDMDDEITPVSEEKAIACCQSWMRVEDYEKRFGEVSE